MTQLRNNLVNLVTLLNDHAYHDGTTIGEQLGITRAAVWKLIKKLQDYGIQIESIKGKGYQLTQPLQLLNLQNIKKHLNRKVYDLIILEKATSTNDILKTIPNNHKITVCLAESQSAGKGRLQRPWYSPFAENIYLSLRYTLEKDISELSGLSLVTALAICKALDESADLKNESLTIKWPNDIYLQGKKLAGILIEIEAESHGRCNVIIGIGINVNMQKALKKQIDQDWSSIFSATGNYTDRNLICVSVINTLINYLDIFSTNGLTYFLTEWKQRDHLQNKTISIKTGNETHQGIYKGINQLGHLKLLKTDGETLSFSSGDATICK